MNVFVDTFVIKMYRDIFSFAQWMSVFADHSNLFVFDRVYFGHDDAGTNLAQMKKQNNNFEWFDVR